MKTINNAFLLPLNSCDETIGIKHNCSGEFYLYNEKGILDGNRILINTQELKTNPQLYQKLEKETGKDYTSFVSFRESSISSLRDVAQQRFNGFAQIPYGNFAKPPVSSVFSPRRLRKLFL